MNYLEYLRRHNRMTQKELACRLSIPLSRYNRIERGWVARIPDYLQNRMRDVLGHEWSWTRLMEEAPPPQPAEPTPADRSEQ